MDIIPFYYSGQEVRTVTKGGEPWFIAKDICSVLGFENPSDATKYLDEDERTLINNPSGAGGSKTTIINEPGLYSLILRSRKPEAKQFKRWITHEVIPTIRKTGGAYLTAAKAEEVLLNPDTIIRLAMQIKELQAENSAKQLQIEVNRPKTIFADAVSSSRTSILIGELAKLIKQNGYDIGQNRLFVWLRDNGYLIKRPGTDWNMPTQRSMELSLFEIKERTINSPDGSIKITKTVKVTGKGQIYFINKFVQGRRLSA